MQRALVIATVVLLLAGCKSTPTTPSGAPVEDRTGTPPTEAPPIQTIRPDEPTGSPLAVLKDPRNILSKRSIYFDFDRYDIKDEFKPLVEAHAKFLQANPSIKMLIQGNADERGSREYNLALGQKRADAVRQALTLLGAKESQIESVSLGEEKPKNEGHDDAAWAENRRGDMLYSGEF